MNIFQRFLQWYTSFLSRSAEILGTLPPIPHAPQTGFPAQPHGQHSSEDPSDQKSIFNQLMDILKGVKHELAPAVIEGKCNFNDFIAWLRKQKLDKGKHTPFIMKLDNEVVKTLGIAPLTKPCGILIGIHDKTTDDITYYAVQCDELDYKTTEILGNEKLVVLQ